MYHKVRRAGFTARHLQSLSCAAPIFSGRNRDKRFRSKVLKHCRRDFLCGFDVNAGQKIAVSWGKETAKRKGEENEKVESVGASWGEEAFLGLTLLYPENMLALCSLHERSAFFCESSHRVGTAGKIAVKCCCLHREGSRRYNSSRNQVCSDSQVENSECFNKIPLYCGKIPLQSGNNFAYIIPGVQIGPVLCKGAHGIPIAGTVEAVLIH